MSSLLDFRIGDECRYADLDLGQSVTCWVSLISHEQSTGAPLIGVTVFRDQPHLVHEWLRPNRLEIILRSRSHRRQLAKGGVS
jgi:hypothetical protein